MTRFTADDRRRGAFTLIELLVVIAIIALLISILLPSLAKAREQTRRVKCGTQMNQILLAAHTYMEQNAGWFVHPQLFPEQVCDQPWVYDNVAKPLPGEKCMAGGEASQVWDCPNNARKRPISPPGGGAAPGGGGWKDPNRQGWDVRYAFVSYGANDWGLGEASMAPDNHDVTGLIQFASNGQIWGLRESMVRQTANFVTFGESNRDGSWDQLAVQDMNDWCMANGESPGAIHPVNYVYGTNVGWFDGHVEWRATWQTYTLDTRIPAGIMLSDWTTLPVQDRAQYRRLWARDYMPHIGWNNDPLDWPVTN